VHAVDYLLKPVSPERLQKALDRVRERGRSAAPDARAVRATARPSPGGLERVVIRDGAQVHVVPVERSITSRPRTTTSASAPVGKCS
jgi:DNA-binding LytR/AlgR family response regulator